MNVEKDILSTDEEVCNKSDSGCLFGKPDDVHPLTPNWVFWIWIGDRDKDWTDCLQQQCRITTVEDFIALKHRILPPSRLPAHEVNYHYFKEGIEPMWEHPANRGGGSIEVSIARMYQHTRLDRLWFELLMACLGAQFEEWNNNICGCSVRSRGRGFTLSLWINNIDVCGSILNMLEAKLGIANDAAVSISFSKHRQM